MNAVWRFRGAGCLLGLSLLAAVGAAAAPAVSRAQGLQYPLSAAVLPDGKLYLADRNLPGIWRAEGGKLQVFFQASKKFRTPLNAVRCVAADGQGRLLAGDSATRDVYRFDEAGQPVALTNGGIGIPMDIAVDGEGRLLVADLELHCIWRVPAAGGMPEKLAEVRAPRGLTMARDGTLWVLNSSDDQLVGIDAQGKLTPIVQGQPFSFAHDVVLDDSGTAYVSDGYAKAIWKVPPGGPPVKWVEGPPLTNPVGLAWRDKQLLVVDPRLPGVLQIAPDGKIEKLELGP